MNPLYLAPKKKGSSSWTHSPMLNPPNRRAAAIQFPRGHPAVKTVVLGMSKPERIRQNVGWFSHEDSTGAVESAQGGTAHPKGRVTARMVRQSVELTTKQVGS